MVHSLQILSDRRAFICRLLIYVITLSLGPRKLRIDAENIQIAEVKESDFMEYVDVEGLIQPILTIKINTRETGSVERIVGEEGSLLQQGRHHSYSFQSRFAPQY